MHQSSPKRIYRLPAYSCGYLHHLKQFFYYPVCAFCACGAGAVYTQHLPCSCQPLAESLLKSLWEHQQCLPQLQGYRDPKLWLSCWHQYVHASCPPNLVENGSDNSFLTWSFLFSSPGHPERDAYKPLESQKSPPFLPLSQRREDLCLVGNRRGQLWCLLCFGDPLFCWTCSARGELGLCCRVAKDMLGQRIGQRACCKKKGDFGKRCF